MELHGDLHSFPLSQLIQTLDNTQRSGKLDLKGHLGEFAIFFQNGRVIHAQSPYSSGLSAFYDAFLERDGTFNFLSSVIMPPRRINATTASLLIEANRLVNDPGSPGMDLEPSKLIVSMSEELSDDPIELEPDEFMLLQTAGEPKTLDRVLRESEFGCFRVWTALSGLTAKKMITLSKTEG